MANRSSFRRGSRRGTSGRGERPSKGRRRGRTPGTTLPRRSARAKPRRPTPLALTRRILLLEDEESSSVLVASYLRGLGCEVDTAERAAAALSIAADRPPDLVIADVALPGERSGLDVVHALWEEYPALPAIVLTAMPARELERFSSRLEGCLLLLKPIELFELERGVRSLLGA